jgi:hypothetical protein
MVWSKRLRDSVTVTAAATLRNHHVSQYMSHHFQKEIAFIGIRLRPSLVDRPARSRDPMVGPNDAEERPRDISTSRPLDPSTRFDLGPAAEMA